jgi:hypothetical protein
MPSTSASINSRPLAPRCSASASAAEATGPAGWMMVFRWVSSKSKVCELMPLSSAAPAMSTRSSRPSTVACGAGSSMRMPASAACTASCRAAPTAQPTQFRNVRCASCSTAALQPADGWLATKRASKRVMGGALLSAATGVLRAMACLVARFPSLVHSSIWILRSRASAAQRDTSAWM